MTERRPPTGLARLDFAATVLADTREAIEQERAGFVRQIADQALTITKLEGQLAAVRQRVAEVMDVVDDAEAEVIVGQAEVERLRRELRAARATIEVLRAERSSTPTVGDAAFAEELAGAVALRREIDAQRADSGRYATGEQPYPGDIVRLPNGRADREVIGTSGLHHVILKGDASPRRSADLRLVGRKA